MARVQVNRELLCSWLSRLFYSQKVLDSKHSSSIFYPTIRYFSNRIILKIASFVGNMFTKETLRQREKNEKSWMHSHLTKELLQQQQIQQMETVQDDQTILIFYKLKHLFFDENTDDEQITVLIKEEPIRMVDRILVTLTQEYSQKVEDLMEPLQDELSSLRKKLKEEREKLQHYLDDNQYLKMMIDRLEEQRKDTELKLNQSQDQFERSKEEIICEFIEKEKLRNQAFNLFRNYQDVFDKYSQMQETIKQNDRQICHLRQINQKYQITNSELTIKYKQITSAISQLNYDNNRIKGENERLRQKVAQQEEKLTNFVDNYNKCNIYSKAFGTEQYSGEEREELGEFVFDYEKDQITSRRSSSRVSELYQLGTEIDCKFLAINASAQKVEAMACMKNVYESQGKKQTRHKLQSSHSRRTKGALHKNASHGCSKAIKTIQPKKYLTKEPHSHRTPSDIDDKIIPEPLLRKKLAEKSQTICLLAEQIDFLKDQCMHITERMTEMQGGYELQLDELKSQLKFTKQKLNEIYRDYLLMKVLSESYQEKISQLEHQIRRIEEEHINSSAEVKKRCKAYIINRIDQIEKQYEMLLERSSQNHSRPQQIEHHEQPEEQQQQEQEIYQQQYDEYESAQYRSLQVIEEEVKMEESSVRKITKEEMLEQSDLHSYGRVESHFFNGMNLDLEFSSHLKDSRGNPNLGDIYIQQRFEIESDLENFTDRLHEDEIKKRQPGIFTERQNFIDSMLSFNPLQSSITQKKLNLSLNSQIYDENISIVQKPLTFINHSSINNSQDLNKLDFHVQIEEFYQPVHKKSQISIHPTYNEMVSLPKEKKHQYNRTFEFMKPQKRQSVLSFQNCLNEQIQAFKQKNLSVCSKSLTVKIQNKGRTIQPTTFSQLEPVRVQKRQNNMQTDKNKLCLSEKCLHFAIQSESRNQMSDVAIQSDHIDNKLTYVKISSFSLMNEASNLSYQSPGDNKETPSTFEPQVQHFKQEQLSAQNMKQYPVQQANSLQNDNCEVIKQIGQEEISKQERLQVRKAQVQVNNKSEKKRWINPSLSLNQQMKENNYPISKEAQKSILINSPSFSEGANQSSFVFADLSNHSEDLQNGPKTINYNPQSKSNKAHIENQSSIDISIFLLMNENKPNQQLQLHSKSKAKYPDTHYEQVSAYLGTKVSEKLFKYLTTKGIKIQKVELIDRKHYKKPDDIAKKLLLFTAKRGNSYTYFGLNSRQIFNIQTEKKIQFDTNKKSRCIDENNFMFGQSEVCVTPDRHLSINRKDKKGILKGDLQNGEWIIQSYMVCNYGFQSSK